MIVNKLEKGWEIVQQPAHALLAMEICAHLDLSEFSAREKAGIMAALALHDDQESYYENGSYLSEEGAPLDFCFLPMDAEMRTKQAKRIVHAAFLKSSLVGALILKHYHHLYSGKKIEAEMKDALDNGNSKNQEHLKKHILTTDRIKKCYEVMCFCDRLSLTLCKDNTPTMGRLLEIGKVALFDKIIFLKRSANEIMSCIPWPFNEKSLSICVEVFTTSTLTFKSDKALKDFLTTAIPDKKEFVFEKT